MTKFSDKPITFFFSFWHFFYLFVLKVTIATIGPFNHSTTKKISKVCNFRNKDIILQNQPKAGLYKNNDKEGKSHLSRAKSKKIYIFLHFRVKNLDFFLAN